MDKMAATIILNQYFRNKTAFKCSIKQCIVFGKKIKMASKMVAINKKTAPQGLINSFSCV